MEIGEIVFYVAIGSAVIYQASRLYKFIFKETEDQQEYESKLKESLADEYIYDPETGARMTLEQAQSGHWIAHNNESCIMSEKEIDSLYTEEEKDAYRTINYLISSKKYKRQKLTSEEVNCLEKTKILGKYKDWSYSDSFGIKYYNGILLIPSVSYGDNDSESQAMFWLKLNTDLGHYYLREKSSVEKLFDLIRNDDELRLANYESFTFKRTENLIVVNDLLKNFEGLKGLEIEFMNNNVFIKNTKVFNYKDVKKIEDVLINLPNDY
ncbi:hypothetical protein AB832_06145 [Flavobacteriaceae bacterium (ex Bugula neritina AB1)]|nr:hypothetical protein AB832_06145 [Flavobacteriaceae bacterium (ex Bugula neritina AB1)]